MAGIAAPFPGDPRVFWDARFAETGFAYGDQPNDFLRQEAAGLPPGRALCLAEGEGRNAVHLAQQGFVVLAQDLSGVGLAKGRQLAASRGVAIETLCGDVAVFEPEVLRQELAGLELLVLEERERWIEEGPYHRGQSAVVQVLGRKAG